jgi:hypothetical protein
VLLGHTDAPDVEERKLKILDKARSAGAELVRGSG